MSITGAPWQARLAGIFFSQLALAGAQVLLYLQGAGPNYTIAGMLIQAAQGAAVAFGLSAYRAAANAIKSVLPNKGTPPADGGQS